MVTIGKSLAYRFFILKSGSNFAAKIKSKRYMSQPMIVWCIIAGVLLCVFIFRSIEQSFTESRNRDRKPKHLLEIGKEKDMFYIPGDINEEDDFEEQ